MKIFINKLFHYPGNARLRPWIFVGTLAGTTITALLTYLGIIPVYLELSFIAFFVIVFQAMLFNAVQVWEQLMFVNNKNLRGIYDMASTEFGNLSRSTTAEAEALSRKIDNLEEKTKALEGATGQLAQMIEAALGESIDSQNY